MIKTARCMHCGNENRVENMKKIDSPSKNYFYVCADCSEKEYGYTQENDIFTHKPAKHGLTWSIELETSERNIQSNWLYQYDFMPSYDCSINGSEWKSPIWKNLSGLKQMFRTIEKKCIINNDCGTHLNIGTYDFNKIDMLKRFYHSLFIPLCNHMTANQEKTIALFGRDFTDYACIINRHTDPNSHSIFINLQHDTHIEFRLCKFVNAEQFMLCIKCCTDMVKAINNNFINHFNDHEADNGITDITAYRKHKAQVTANKLISIYDKYTR